ncbi:hypothetical protein CANCADRAFT_30070 [Tortispora caseinolytica NRRL Y-17796]|uniref:Ribosome assembly factor mrt4 n=1 Tax=Tortispora caseinolytica NRRL Y-17796 TaxID=767744 RepID=A0A1E4TIY4_9ASCO|nr:hypothetical protein CANCADRAFT_30070 [Tortispora caseinolytica NRRL Y-17796]
MPKSKRAKVVSLTKTDKKGKENKERIFNEIRDAIDQYAYIWVFSVDNMRNTFVKDIRSDWVGSKIFMSKSKVMAKALGSTPEEEYVDNVHELADQIKGEVGLLFTDEKVDVVKEYFESFSKLDFARAGTKSNIDFTIPEGVVYSRGGQIPYEDDIPLAHMLEPTIRQLGAPTRFKDGKVFLDQPYEVCKSGQVLDSRQTRLLKQFGVVSAEFKITLKAFYDKAAQKTEIL